MISTCLANNSRSPPWKRREAAWEGTLRARQVITAGAVVASTVLITAACSSSSSGAAAGSAASNTASSSSTGSSSSNIDFATCDSVAQCGGMSALVAAAKKEGQLNVITLPSNWANYGTIMSDFKAKYGISITDANPEGSSAQELQAVTQLKGQSTAPDVVDVGGSFAAEDQVRPDLVQVAAYRPVQERGRDRWQPGPDRVGVRRRVRRGPVQRRLVREHRPRHQLLQAAEGGRQLQPGRGDPGH